jgi:prophage DNA circulation protein
MSWREDLIAASFRGAAFKVRSHSGSVGRRVQVHEFPLRNKPYTEDLGRKTREFKIEAYVLGENYMGDRDALLRAVEVPGPGQLQHPYLGEMRATCTQCEVREETQDGGVARFTLEFVEAGDLAFTGVAASTGAAVVAAADVASNAAQSSFVRRHSVAGKPAFVAQASQSVFSQAVSGMQGAVGRVRAAAERVAELNRDVEAQRRDLVTLIYTPASAAQALAGNLRLLVRNVATAPRDALALARLFYRFGSLLPAVDPSTSSRRQLAANQHEMLQLVRVVALAEGARAAAAVAFVSYQDALDVRDEITDGIDSVLNAASDDATFDALRALRAAVVRDVAARGANLARLVRWVPAATMPVLVAAQQLYAAPDRADELVQRNRIRHPLFVAGAQPIEVLSNA